MPVDNIVSGARSRSAVNRGKYGGRSEKKSRSQRRGGRK